MSLKIQKRGGVVHNGYRDRAGDPVSNCGSGERYAMGSLRQMNKWIVLPEDTETTCKKCKKQADEAERLGLHLTVTENEDGSRRVVDTRNEVAAEAESIEDTMQALANVEADAECERARRLAEYDAEDEAAYIEDGLKADADAGTYTFVNEVAVLRDAPGRAIVTAAFNGTTVGGSIVRKGKRLVLTAGKVTVSATSFEKIAKRFAMKLGFFADRIDVARSF